MTNLIFWWGGADGRDDFPVCRFCPKEVSRTRKDPSAGTTLPCKPEHKPRDKTLFLPSGQSVSSPLGYLTLSIITLYVIWFVQEVVPVLVDYCLLLKRL